ncbi:MAG: AzlD domain-containing protein [Actinomycetota bacterium]|nr:AzlD domain-containing protein [Actinomycetota bacterium]
MIWAAVLIGSLGCYLEKLFGFILPPALLDRPMIRSVAALLPIAMLAALVAVQTFGSGQSLVIDARLAGVAVAVVALLLRAPFLAVVLAAAITAALLRASGLAT